MTAGCLVRRIELPADAMLALHAAWPQRYPALLESAAAGTTHPLPTPDSAGSPPAPERQSYDLLLACPGERLTLDTDGLLRGPGGHCAEGEFLAALDEWWRREGWAATNAAAAPGGALADELARMGLGGATADVQAASLPFTGGWLLYLGYELAAQIEPRLRLPCASHGVIAQAVRIPAAILREHTSGAAWLIAEAHAGECLARMAADLAALERRASPERSRDRLVRGAVREDDPSRYLQAVARALDYIAAGDVYQANLARSWCADLVPGVRPHELYRRLRRTNPGPFSGILTFDDSAIVSSSPERLVEVRGRHVSTRPIAGTRPRGKDAAADRALVQELRMHPKERAEHVMLIDLERNDLGKLCEAGSVQVDELMTIESYAHVHHIVSNVSGRLRPGISPGQVLAAVFPGGTITGCPKVRCMEIIAELEQAPRGAYTGSFGYLNLDGSMDMNILIRSLQVHGEELSLHAGAGIVADSIAQRELEETRAKARGVLRALEGGP